MTNFMRSATAVFLAGLAALCLLRAQAVPAPSPLTASSSPVYVALGDSYSSGEGVRPYIKGTDTRKSSPTYDSCHRTRKAYPFLVAAGRADYVFEDLACAGAKSGNVGWLEDVDQVRGNAQFPKSSITPGVQMAALKQAALREDIALVTITIGGNDLGFSHILRDCAQARRGCDTVPPSDWAGKDGAGPPGNRQPYSEYADRDIEWTRPRVRRVFDAIKFLAPDARVLVVGYPHLFPSGIDEQRCRNLRPWSPHEQNFLNRKTDDFNTMIAQEAAGAGAEFVASVEVFSHHEPCGSKGGWLSGPVLPRRGEGGILHLGRGSFHPTAQGQVALASVVQEALDENLPMRVIPTIRHGSYPSISGIPLFTTRAKVEKRLGRGVKSPTPGSFVRYPAAQLTIGYGHGDQDRPTDQVRSITTRSLGAKTDRGVGVGSTLAEIKRTYPRLVMFEGNGWLYQNEVGEAESSSDTEFIIHGGRVSAIRIIWGLIAG